MFKKNKWKILFSSVMVLLPILFGVIMWNDLPVVMTTHWGADANPDGFSGKAFAVFGLPSILLVLHFICLLFTLLDKKQQEQNQKALGVVFWIMPMISVFSSGIIYCTALGKEFKLLWFLPALIGVMFMFIGNYLPKVKQNRTLGIKISWTLQNEENWNKTHRFGGKLWVAGGLIMLFSVFLPVKAMVWLLISVIAAAVTAPVVYSYCIYRKHKKEGVVYEAAPRSKADKIGFRISAIVIPIILIGVSVLMFTGNIDVQCKDTSFAIHTTYWTDIEVDYSEIDTVERCKDLDLGVRTSGFASARLSLGIFRNDEFGSYTLYAYTGAEEYIVLTSEAKTLVIGMRSAEDTQAIYDAILEKIAE